MRIRERDPASVLAAGPSDEKSAKCASSVLIPCSTMAGVGGTRICERSDANVARLERSRSSR